jgi:predicted Ser/Thr protein kinase
MMNEGTRVKEFTREEIREIAEETLKALGVDTGELSEEEREVIRKAVEEWRGRKGYK